MLTRVAGLALAICSASVADIVMPGTYPGALHTAPGGQLICACPHVDDDCKCVILTIQSATQIGEDVDYIYYSATISQDPTSGTPIYTTSTTGQEMIAVEKDKIAPPAINLPGREGLGPGGLITCTCPLNPWSCRCWWGSSYGEDMGDAFYSEDSAYAYYRAVREQSSPDAVPTFTINPTGTYLVALDKAFRQE